MTPQGLLLFDASHIVIGERRKNIYNKNEKRFYYYLPIADGGAVGYGCEDGQDVYPWECV